MSVEGEFFVIVTGSIEFAEFYDADNLYLKYEYHSGPEWTVVGVRKFTYMNIFINIIIVDQIIHFEQFQHFPRYLFFIF